MSSWVTIPGYDGLYQANKNGRIWSVRKERLLSTASCGGRYCTIVLVKNGVKKPKTAHRIIAELFVPNPLNKPMINHKNGVKTDNRSSNLQWVSSKENVIHAHKVGLKLIPSGKDNPMYGRFGYNSNRGKSVEQIDIASHKVINMFGSARDAARNSGVHVASITSCCRGEIRNPRKFIWRYV